MSKFTKKAIMHEFMKILEEKSLDKITVKDICERSEINRNTFYYYFDNVYDVLYSIFEIEKKQMLEDVEFDAGDDAGDGETSVLNEALLSMLRGLRSDIAKEKEVPPYVIFQDVSLEDMATFCPTTLEELQNVRGVGEGKVLRYGKKFCKLIQDYCEENDIHPVDDLRVRTLVNKSKRKVDIIQSIDRRVMLDDLAHAQGLSMEELLDEIEAIVYSGTKLNIKYYLDEALDEDHVEDIYDYFLEDSETDDLDEALDELGGEYTEEEVRLVRVQFLSDYAN